jgi:hypothetical protein
MDNLSTAKTKSDGKKVLKSSLKPNKNVAVQKAPAMAKCPGPVVLWFISGESLLCDNQISASF